jgi:hypothetical protein
MGGILAALFLLISYIAFTKTCTCWVKRYHCGEVVVFVRLEARHDYEFQLTPKPTNPNSHPKGLQSNTTQASKERRKFK